MSARNALPTVQYSLLTRRSKIQSSLCLWEIKTRTQLQLNFGRDFNCSTSDLTTCLSHVRSIAHFEPEETLCMQQHEQYGSASPPPRLCRLQQDMATIVDAITEANMLHTQKARSPNP